MDQKIRYRVFPDKHTQTGKQIWKVELLDRVPKTEWKSFFNKLKDAMGQYVSMWQGRLVFQEYDPSEELKEYFGDADAKVTVESDPSVVSMQDIYAYIDKVKEAEEHYYKTNFPNLKVPEITMTQGKKYYKVWKGSGVSQSIFAFIDRAGNIYKPANTNAPAKGVRGNVKDPNVPLSSGDLYSDASKKIQEKNANMSELDSPLISVSDLEEVVYPDFGDLIELPNAKRETKVFVDWMEKGKTFIVADKPEWIDNQKRWKTRTKEPKEYSIEGVKIFTKGYLNKKTEEANELLKYGWEQRLDEGFVEWYKDQYFENGMIRSIVKVADNGKFVLQNFIHWREAAGSKFLDSYDEKGQFDQIDGIRVFMSKLIGDIRDGNKYLALGKEVSSFESKQKYRSSEIVAEDERGKFDKFGNKLEEDEIVTDWPLKIEVDEEEYTLQAGTNQLAIYTEDNGHSITVSKEDLKNLDLFTPTISGFMSDEQLMSLWNENHESVTAISEAGYYNYREYKIEQGNDPLPMEDHFPNASLVGNKGKYDFLITDAGGLIMVSNKNEEDNGEYANIAGVNRHTGAVTWYDQEAFLDEDAIAFVKELSDRHKSNNEEVEHDNKFDYTMLSRYKQDVDYYLGHGGRNSRHLYFEDEQKHIDEMKKLWNKIIKKPEWLSMEQIEDYERQMIKAPAVDEGRPKAAIMYGWPTEHNGMKLELISTDNIAAIYSKDGDHYAYNDQDMDESKSDSGYQAEQVVEEIFEEGKWKWISNDMKYNYEEWLKENKEEKEEGIEAEIITPSQDIVDYLKYHTKNEAYQLNNNNLKSKFIDIKQHVVNHNYIGSQPDGETEWLFFYKPTYEDINVGDEVLRDVQNEWKLGVVEKKQAGYIDIKDGGSYKPDQLVIKKSAKDFGESKSEVENYVSKNYKNAHEVNEGVRAFVKSNPDQTKWTNEEKEFVARYQGSGGLEKYGANDKGMIYEYFTPDIVVQKMWALAVQYGFSGGKVLEPSVGTGNFLKYVNWTNSDVICYEINEVSSKIVKALYPAAEVRNESFANHFYGKTKGTQFMPDQNFEKDFDLVIGNPPYGSTSIERKMSQEKTALKVSEMKFEHYFMIRGLDCLKSGGLLVYITTNNFFTKGYEAAKKLVTDRATLIDAYLLPTSTFKTTSVGTAIIVLRKK